MYWDNYKGCFVRESVFTSSSHFHCTENDSQPDCSRLLRQRSICHGELLSSKHTHRGCLGWFVKMFPCAVLPSFTQGESHPEGSLCDFQAWWLTYFGETKLN